MNQQRDENNGKVMLVAAHDCANYGVQLSVLFMRTDWNDRFEKHYRVIDQETGEEIYGNELQQCGDVQDRYVVCNFYLAPDNPRMGLLFDS